MPNPPCVAKTKISVVRMQVATSLQDVSMVRGQKGPERLASTMLSGKASIRPCRKLVTQASQVPPRTCTKLLVAIKLRNRRATALRCRPSWQTHQTLRRTDGVCEASAHLQVNAARNQRHEGRSIQAGFGACLMQIPLTIALTPTLDSYPDSIP